MAILIALQQKTATAQSLADKLEVSKRTILRDMQALSEMGIPLYATTGPSGGFHLMDGYQLPPLHFDSQEALTVLFALNALTKMADTPFNQARWTTMNKLTAIMPPSILKQVEPILNHVEIEVPNRSYKTPFLTELLKFASEAIWIKAHYRSEKHQRWLQLLPHRVYMAHGFWYCEAYSMQHQEQRTFRADRFDHMEVMKPEQADSCQAEMRNEKPDAILQPIHIRAKLTYRGALLAERDPDIGEYVKHVADDEWELEFMCPAEEWTWAIKFFYTLGLDAEVMEPRALQNEIYQMASQVCSRYQ
ncbi:HTH domain protein [compost metagenome]